jgi:hypothetical protein
MKVRETVQIVVDWIHLVQNRDQWQAVVNTVLNLRVPLKAGNFSTNWVTVSFYSLLLFFMELIRRDWRD